MDCAIVIGDVLTWRIPKQLYALYMYWNAVSTCTHMTEKIHKQKKYILPVYYTIHKLQKA